MKVESLQRTFIVGLGHAGAQIAGAVVAQLEGVLGRIGIFAGMVVQADQTEAETVDLPPLLLSTRTNFRDWQAEFEQAVAEALGRISQLHHLTTLAQSGFSLNRPDELHLIIVADLNEPWVGSTLTDVVDSLRGTVSRTLSCQAGLTGVLIGSNATPLPSALARTSSRSSLYDAEAASMEITEAFSEEAGRQVVGLFERGCFLVSLTNEAGLIVGELADLVQRAAHFLVLLVTSPLGLAVAGLMEAGGSTEMTAATFGLAAVRWPGVEVVQALSRRWTLTVLWQLLQPESRGITPPGDRLVEKAREAAQQLVIAERLAPPALLEQLDRLIPPLPDYLLEKVPDPPWPWLLAEVQASLEQDPRHWEMEWPATRQTLAPVLDRQAAAWPALAQQWLEQQLAQPEPGVSIRLKAYMAALSELLTAFVEGVEERLIELEGDLLAVERQVSQATESLAAVLARLPRSPLAALWQWRLHPQKWWQGWQRCREAQAGARELARRLRQRLLVLQAVRLHEMLLPFYQTLQTQWTQGVEAWVQNDEAVRQATQLSTLTGWQEQLNAALKASSGPWTRDRVEALYHEAAREKALGLEIVIRGGQDLPGLAQWVAVRSNADEISQQLQDYAAGVLRPFVVVPVDAALARQFPDDVVLADWLAACLAQANPFWRYDEAALDEAARSQVSLARCLFLPGAESSPLAGLVRSSRPPLMLLDSLNPEELAAVTVRWGVSARELGALSSSPSEQIL